MGWRQWFPIETVKIEDGKVYNLEPHYLLGYLSDIDKNLKGEEVVEVEFHDPE